MANAITEEYIHPVDVKKAYVLKRILDRKVVETDYYDVPFMPLRPFIGRKVLLTVMEANGAGLAAFKADNSNTPIIEGGGVVQEMYIELVTISEKDVFNATDLIALESPDDYVARVAARTLIDKAKNLKLRNINRSRWMAWQAVKDQLTITYPNATSINVDWDFDGSSTNSYFTGSHLPTAAVNWDAKTADEYTTDIIEDVYAWTKLIADDLGINASECILHLNSTTWRYVRRNKHLLEQSNPTYSERKAPLKAGDVADILDIAGIKIMNPYYLEDDGLRTKHYLLPDGHVLITGPYEIRGVPIAELYDGLVALVDGNNEVRVARNPGMQAEIYINAEQAAKNVRVTTGRMPIINYPAAFVYAKVVS